MKKLALAALAAATMISTPAFADTTVIYASIAEVCTVDGPDNKEINLSGSTPLGNVVAQCNNATGFTFQIQSLNNFALIDQDAANGNGTTYPYTLSVAGLPGTISNNVTFNSAPGLNAAIITPQSAAVTVNVAAPTGPAYAGVYQDTITWTIAAN